jgi:hypothetical protein
MPGRCVGTRHSGKRLLSERGLTGLQGRKGRGEGRPTSRVPLKGPAVSKKVPLMNSWYMPELCSAEMKVLMLVPLLKSSCMELKSGLTSAALGGGGRGAGGRGGGRGLGGWGLGGVGEGGAPGGGLAGVAGAATGTG